MSALLEIRDLSVSFATRRGEMRVLRDVSLDVGRGRIVGIVGESGSGKSTLATAILKLLPANLSHLSGTIRLAGDDLLQKSEAEMRRLRGNRVAMVFQDPMSSLNPVFTIGTQLVDVQRAKDPALSRKAARARALAMLERVGIADAAARLKAYPHQFSGGMRQRIMISMALLAEPDLLICDEPTTALDVTIEAQIVRLLERLRDELGVAIIFISHSLGLVSELCDEVAVMYAGTLVETAPAATLFADPRHPYTQALLAAELSTRDDTSRRLISIPGGVPDLTRVPAGCIYVERCPVSIPICRTTEPDLRHAGPGHAAACVHVGSAP